MVASGFNLRLKLLTKSNSYLGISSRSWPLWNKLFSLINKVPRDDKNCRENRKLIALLNGKTWATLQVGKTIRFQKEFLKIQIKLSFSNIES